VQANTEWELAGNDGNFIGAEENFWTENQNEREWHNKQFSPMSDHSPCNEETASFTFDLGYDFDPNNPDAEEGENDPTILRLTPPNNKHHTTN
jgi:hypothetical protein